MNRCGPAIFYQTVWRRIFFCYGWGWGSKHNSVALLCEFNKGVWGGGGCSELCLTPRPPIIKVTNLNKNKRKICSTTWFGDIQHIHVMFRYYLCLYNLLKFQFLINQLHHYWTTINHIIFSNYLFDFKCNLAKSKHTKNPNPHPTPSTNPPKRHPIKKEINQNLNKTKKNY